MINFILLPPPVFLTDILIPKEECLEKKKTLRNNLYDPATDKFLDKNDLNVYLSQNILKKTLGINKVTEVVSNNLNYSLLSFLTDLVISNFKHVDFKKMKPTTLFKC